MKKIDIRQLDRSAVKMINDEWALLSAGDETGFNTMTVSWGGLGELWNRDVAFVFVRPQRYTKEFIDKSGRFSLCFFEGEYKKEMGFCGKYSGRDYDKAKETGLTPAFEDGVCYFEEAHYVLICKILYEDDIKPENFVDTSLDSACYPNRDYHRVYVAQIEKVLAK